MLSSFRSKFQPSFLKTFTPPVQLFEQIRTNSEITKALADKNWAKWGKALQENLSRRRDWGLPCVPFTHGVRLHVKRATVTFLSGQLQYE